MQPKRFKIMIFGVSAVATTIFAWKALWRLIDALDRRAGRAKPDVLVLSFPGYDRDAAIPQPIPVKLIRDQQLFGLGLTPSGNN